MKELKKISLIMFIVGAVLLGVAMLATVYIELPYFVWVIIGSVGALPMIPAIHLGTYAFVDMLLNGED